MPALRAKAFTDKSLLLINSCILIANAFLVFMVYLLFYVKLQFHNPDRQIYLNQRSR